MIRKEDHASAVTNDRTHDLVGSNTGNVEELAVAEFVC